MRLDAGKPAQRLEQTHAVDGARGHAGAFGDGFEGSGLMAFFADKLMSGFEQGGASALALVALGSWLLG